MRRGALVNAAYRVLRPQVSWALIGTFVICVLGGALINSVTGSLRGAFILFALAFVGQSLVFLGARYSPEVRKLVANPGLVEQRESLVFAVGLLSAFAAVFLAFMAIR